MRKICLAVILSILVMPLMANGTSEVSTEPQATAQFVGNAAADEAKTVNGTIGFWSSMAATSDAERALVEELSLEWANKHPDQKVEIQVIPGDAINQTMSKLLTAAAAGNAPDFAQVDSFWIGNFMDAGAIKPIDQFIPEGESDQFFDFTKKVTQRNGKQYALWAETDARLLYYRKDLISEAPRTWGDVIETALMVKEKNGIHGYLTPGKAEGLTNDSFLPYFWAQGGQLFDPDQDWKPVMGEGQNRDAMIKAFSFLEELIDTEAMPRDIAGMSHPQLLAEARADNVGMMITGSWVLPQMMSLIPDAESKWGYTSYPQEKADQYSNTNGGWAWVFFSEDDAKRKIAFDFVWDTAISKSAMSRRCAAYGYLPTRADVYEDDFYKNNVFFDFLKEELNNGNSRPPTSLYPTISTYIQEIGSEIIIGDMDPETAVDEIYKKSMAAWKEAQSRK
ncbi:extracellular solute-binding protein [Oceanispirochaeta crateris]|uniref:Extracellular solute-binding protein n=1 Tax=Oceanispirochaeta crateris TaxID=2518645 RepID=A0A5C1QIA1_9SPIO|nr:extracellular solute-binding protein [Oceanispirochaeta crateris]QEN06730.1 extracellular solute-binding protein [Oceanispirochaeta crateris]